MKDQRFAWAITGAGHTLTACADQLLRFKNIDVLISMAAKEVIRMYSLQERFESPDLRVIYETQASSPVVARLYNGVYRVLVVAPATSNSVAKFVCGISDSLISNLFAQAGKSHVPIIVFPTDLAAEMDTTGPHGEPVKVYPRPVDLENTNKLRDFPGVTVVESVEDLTQCLATYL
ncbi:MAG TPA: flavoprotein [Anaerolineaceae bacterium]|nr:flavoprotein [Anaerolineaceae bacterium]